MIILDIIFVTPYGGVWIEMKHYDTYDLEVLVTPYGGVWIEILPIP